MHAKGWHLRKMAGLEEIDGRPGTCPAAAIEADGLLILLHVHQSEHVAANSGRVRLNDVQNSGGTDCRIHSVSAVLQNTESGRRSQRLARCHHAVDGKNRRTGSTGLGSGTITVS